MNTWTQEEKSLLWLDSFPIDPSGKWALVHAAGSAVELVKRFSSYGAHVSDEKLFASMQETLKDGEYFLRLKSRLEAENITPVFFGGAGYPKGWLTLPDAPLCLYAKGKVGLLEERKLAIVGSRRTTEGARKLGAVIAKELTGCFAVVTGSADGGDEAVLKGGLEGGKVICLLAGGLGAIPKENLLLGEVEKHGLLLAACPYDTPVRVYSYEYRNKLLALMSEGVLVLGAAKKSGALITARYAKEAGKAVFAIPYAPSVLAGEGCNALIKQGAYLTESSADIVEKYGYTAVEKKAVTLSETEEKVRELLVELGETHISELAKASGLPTFKLMTVLSSLEIKGVAVKLGGNRYAAV